MIEAFHVFCLFFIFFTFCWSVSNSVSLSVPIGSCFSVAAGHRFFLGFGDELAMLS